MDERVRAVIAVAEDRTRDGWNDPVRGTVSCVTLFSSDITPTDELSAGIAEIEPGNALNPHRHRQAELYYIIEGTGLMMLAGEAATVAAGTSVFIPGDAEHGIRNIGDGALRLFYVFPTASFGDVVYRFPDPA